jgi:hypothetical protein
LIPENRFFPSPNSTAEIQRGEQKIKVPTSRKGEREMGHTRPMMDTPPSDAERNLKVKGGGQERSPHTFTGKRKRPHSIKNVAFI